MPYKYYGHERSNRVLREWGVAIIQAGWVNAQISVANETLKMLLKEDDGWHDASKKVGRGKVRA